jgi:hypothetical protein
MKLTIGTKVTLNKKPYTVVGKAQRSILVEDPKGKKFKISFARLKKYTGIDYTDCVPKAKSPCPIEKMVSMMQIFDKSIKMPTDEASCSPFFERLEAEASPENLSCDGELSFSAVMRKKADINNCWKALEKIQGKKREMVV